MSGGATRGCSLAEFSRRLRGPAGIEPRVLARRRLLGPWTGHIEALPFLCTSRLRFCALHGRAALGRLLTSATAATPPTPAATSAGTIIAFPSLGPRFGPTRLAFRVVADLVICLRSVALASPMGRLDWSAFITDDGHVLIGGYGVLSRCAIGVTVGIVAAEPIIPARRGAPAGFVAIAASTPTPTAAT